MDYTYPDLIFIDIEKDSFISFPSPAYKIRLSGGFEGRLWLAGHKYNLSYVVFDRYKFKYIVYDYTGKLEFK